MAVIEIAGPHTSELVIPGDGNTYQISDVADVTMERAAGAINTPNIIVQAGGELVRNPGGGKIRFLGIDNSIFVGGGDPSVHGAPTDSGLWVLGGRLEIPAAGPRVPRWFRGWSPEWDGSGTYLLAPLLDDRTFTPVSFGEVLPTLADGMPAAVIRIDDDFWIEGEPGRHAHIFISQDAPAQNINGGLRYMGVHGVAGRMPVHLHGNGETARGSSISVTVRDWENTALQAHLSNGINFHRSIGYQGRGAFFAWNFGLANATHDISITESAAAALRTLSAAEARRFHAFRFAHGDRNSVIDCAVLGMIATGAEFGPGSSNAAGFFWPESGGGVWTGRNLYAQGVPAVVGTWQNNSNLHVVENVTGFNVNALINHGAYTNIYQYIGVDGAANEAGIHLHSNAGPPEDIPSGGRLDQYSQAFENVTVRNAPIGITVQAARAPEQVPTLFLNCHFENVGLLALMNDATPDGGGVPGDPKTLDFKDCTINGRLIEPTDFDLSGMGNFSLIRVEDSAGAWTLNNAGTVTQVEPFYTLQASAGGNFADTDAVPLAVFSNSGSILNIDPGVLPTGGVVLLAIDSRQSAGMSAPPAGWNQVFHNRGPGDDGNWTGLWWRLADGSSPGAFTIDFDPLQSTPNIAHLVHLTGIDETNPFDQAVQDENTIATVTAVDFGTTGSLAQTKARVVCAVAIQHMLRDVAPVAPLVLLADQQQSKSGSGSSSGYRSWLGTYQANDGSPQFGDAQLSGGARYSSWIAVFNAAPAAAPDPVVADFSIAPAISGNVPFTVTVQDLSTGPAFSVNVDFDGEASFDIAPGGTATFEFTSPGLKAIHLVVTGDQGQTDVLTQTVEVIDPTPEQVVAGFAVDLPNGNTVPFDVQVTDQSTGPIGSVLIDWGDGSPGETMLPGGVITHTYQAEGPFTITQTVTSSIAGQPSDSQTAIVQGVDPTVVPVTALFAGLPAAINLGDFVQIQDQSSGPIASILVEWGDGSSSPLSPGQSISHIYVIPQTFQITYTVTGDQGQTDVATGSVDVLDNRPVSVSIGALQLTGQAPHEVFIQPQPSGPVTGIVVDWGDSSPTEVLTALEFKSHVYSAAGIFTIEVTVTGPVGQSSSNTVTATITDPPAPEDPIIDFFIDGQAFQLDGAQIDGIVDFELDPGSMSFTQVELLINGTPVEINSTGRFTVDTAQLGNGQHTAEMIVVQGAGGSTSTIATFTVNNTLTNPPSLALGGFILVGGGLAAAAIARQRSRRRR